MGVGRLYGVIQPPRIAYSGKESLESWLQMVEETKIEGTKFVRHITFASIATVLPILGSIGGGIKWMMDYVNEKHSETVQAAIEHEKHDYELDRRLDGIQGDINNLRLAMKMAVSNDSPKQRELVDQVLQLQSQLQAVKETQKDIKNTINQQYPADAPAVEKPQ